MCRWGQIELMVELHREVLIKDTLLATIFNTIKCIFMCARRCTLLTMNKQQQDERPRWHTRTYLIYKKSASLSADDTRIYALLNILLNVKKFTSIITHTTHTHTPTPNSMHEYFPFFGSPSSSSSGFGGSRSHKLMVDTKSWHS